MSGTIHFLKKNKKNIVTNTSFYNSPKLPSKHNHIEIFFDDCKIVYNDPRRFGFFEIVENDELLKKKYAFNLNKKSHFTKSAFYNLYSSLSKIDKSKFRFNTFLNLHFSEDIFEYKYCKLYICTLI